LGAIEAGLTSLELWHGTSSSVKHSVAIQDYLAFRTNAIKPNQRWSQSQDMSIEMCAVWLATSARRYFSQLLIFSTENGRVPTPGSQPGRKSAITKSIGNGR
jgi:hypothetical protein